MMLRRGIRYNVAYNFAGNVIPVIAAVLTVPSYLKAIGDARYGVLALVWLVFGYMGLFDFGLSRATAHRLSVLRHKPLRARANVFYTACLMNTAIGVTVAAFFYVFAIPALRLSINNSLILNDEVVTSLPLIAGFFPLALLGGVLIGCMEASERFLEVNVQHIVGAVLLQCLPLLFVLWLGPDLRVAVLGAITGRLFSMGWLAVSCLVWALPAGRPRIDRHHARELLRYGGWITVSNGLLPMLNGVDQFVIGSTLGATAVAHYSVPFSMAGKALILPGALTRALFPRLSAADPSEAQALSRRALIFLAQAMAVICGPAILLSEFGLRLWVGQDFANQAHTTAELLLLGTWFSGLGYIPFTHLQGQNRPDVIAKLHAIEMLPFIALLYSFITAFGLAGAALAWCLRAMIDSAILYWRAGFPTRTLLALLWPASAMGGAIALAHFAHPDGLSAIFWSSVIAAPLLARFAGNNWRA